MCNSDCHTRSHMLAVQLHGTDKAHLDEHHGLEGVRINIGIALDLDCGANAAAAGTTCRCISAAQATAAARSSIPRLLCFLHKMTSFFIESLLLTDEELSHDMKLSYPSLESVRRVGPLVDISCAKSQYT